MLRRIQILIRKVEGLMHEGVKALLISLWVDELFFNDKLLSIIKNFH